ncbi:hypothetical protein ABW20_dc0104301 [Dactylellina cionopaga]|nr:hypothetical protein ABW20_dc0104301 [Dactylellina cionopaga]
MRLRTENDVLRALRDNGYVPAVDRVDEMLDMNRSPFQTIDEFDKITLGLLMKSARTVDGGIRNPYRIPHLVAGQNPVRAHNGKYPRYLPPTRFFLFPDDTNWQTISHYFPLREPPRPWHPVVMMGLKQDYSKEEVARRLEWSKVQNAKRFRNGYHWPPPDPTTYEFLETLPPPPPPVIRACNTCHKPRYLMRFWNFYFQRWQHVTSPHRPYDCGGHQRGTCGRLMYAPKGTKINGTKSSQVENKEWIDEETAIKLLFRSAFIPLPAVNADLGIFLAKASINAGDFWDWTSSRDVERWALRGGRSNGLVNLVNVKKMEGVEAARAQQQEQFMTHHAALLEAVRELLKEHPITPKAAAKIPPGQFYPENHPAVSLWREYETSLLRTNMEDRKEKGKNLRTLKNQIQSKLALYDKALEEMKVTKAEILLLERGQGEVWADPNFISLPSEERVEILEGLGELRKPKAPPRERPSTYKVYEHFLDNPDFQDKGYGRSQRGLSEVQDRISELMEEGYEEYQDGTIEGAEAQAYDDTNATLEGTHSSPLSYRPLVKSNIDAQSEGPDQPPNRQSQFSTRPPVEIDQYRKRFVEDLTYREASLDLENESSKKEAEYVAGRLAQVRKQEMASAGAPSEPERSWLDKNKP